MKHSHHLKTKKKKNKAPIQDIKIRNSHRIHTELFSWTMDWSSHAQARHYTAISRMLKIPKETHKKNSQVSGIWKQGNLLQQVFLIKPWFISVDLLSLLSYTHVLQAVVWYSPEEQTSSPLRNSGTCMEYVSCRWLYVTVFLVELA